MHNHALVFIFVRTAVTDMPAATHKCNTKLPSNRLSLTLGYEIMLPCNGGPCMSLPLFLAYFRNAERFDSGVRAHLTISC